MKKFYPLILVVFLIAFTETTHAQINARILYFADVSASQITFAYAGDIWLVPIEGGVAHKLSSPPGEEIFPKFSPDGTQIVFTGNYDGNMDIYVMPATGGIPERLTHHGMGDRVINWHPDGERILYSSAMKSGRQRYSQFYLQPTQGGLPEQLPVPYGEFGDISEDGRYIAFTTRSRLFRTWKRYRGGMAADIYLFDLKNQSSQKIAPHPANDELPMWHGETVYFLSDRGPDKRYNIWAYNINSEEVRQITQFGEFDIHFPSIGPEHIVFEAGGRLYLLDLQTEEYSEVDVDVITDRATLQPRTENVSEQIFNAWISPDGNRAIFEARGDLFSVPAENGYIKNLVRTSGVAERTPAWSPDGKSVAYWSDKTGEYELTLIDLTGNGEEQTLTSYGSGFRYQIYWSPDSKKLAFVDNAMVIQIYDLEKERTTRVDQGLWMMHGGLDNFKASWYADSRWLAYSRGLENRHGAVFLYDTEENDRHQVTSGFYDDNQPVFDPDGKYLYYFSNRHFSPEYSDMDESFIYPNATKIVAVSLRRDVPSLLAPKNDTVKVKPEEENSGEKQEEEADEKEPESVEIDLHNFEHCAVLLPPKPGNYHHLSAAPGKVVYRRIPRTGSAEEESPLVYFDLEKREEQTVVEDVDGYRLSADHSKVLVANDGSYAIVDLAPDQKMEKQMPTADMEMKVEPQQEWRQIFMDAWRMERDYFYDPNMHGVDWNAIRQQYSRLLEDAVTRWDVNFVIGEMIAELNASHTYRGGGDTPETEDRSVGYLGIDWEASNGAYRVKGIIRGAQWDLEPRSPLDMPGVAVEEGDYILAVNGEPLDIFRDPWAGFQGLAG